MVQINNPTAHSWYLGWMSHILSDQPLMKSRYLRLWLRYLLFIRGWSSSIWLIQPRYHSWSGGITVITPLSHTRYSTPILQKIPAADLCCSEKLADTHCRTVLQWEKTRYPLRSGYLVFSHATANQIPAAGFSSVGSWCKPIIQPPTRGILVDRATYFRTNHLWKGDTRAYGLGISFPFVVGPQVYGSVKQDTTRGSVGLLLIYCRHKMKQLFFTHIHLLRDFGGLTFAHHENLMRSLSL